MNAHATISKAHRIFCIRRIFTKYVREKAERQYQELNAKLSEKGVNVSPETIHKEWQERSTQELDLIREERDNIIEKILDSMGPDEYSEYVQALSNGDVFKEEECDKELELARELR